MRRSLAAASLLFSLSGCPESDKGPAADDTGPSADDTGPSAEPITDRFVVGDYNGGWDCLEIYSVELSELGAEALCDDCELAFTLTATWSEGAPEREGQTSCGLDTLTNSWAQEETFTTTWGFDLQQPDDSDTPYDEVFYSYAGSWYINAEPLTSTNDAGEFYIAWGITASYDATGDLPESWGFRIYPYE